VEPTVAPPRAAPKKLASAKRKWAWKVNTNTK
jgi:hypothetical protein